MIDLIIPAYNAEDTIGRALASVAAQTKQRKFLITVIDDCSTDNTAAIVNKFKGILPIKYIKLKKNLGKPGLVRNIGIERTTCPYIMFLDADDMLMPMAAELLSRASLQYRPDIIFGQFLVEFPGVKEEEKYELYGTDKITWLHGNLYSRKFLKNNGIMFDDNLNEDGSFNLKSIKLAQTIYKIEQPISIWCHNEKSITRSNKDFLIGIGEDYIKTYSDAIKFILKKRPEQANRSDFREICGLRLAEFFEYIDAYLYYGKNTDKLLYLVDDYVTFIKKYDIVDKNFIEATNERFNDFKFFPNMRRQQVIGTYFSTFKIDSKEE